MPSKIQPREGSEESVAGTHDRSLESDPGIFCMISAVDAQWHRLPVQIKFLAIAITLIILSVSGAFLFLQQDYYENEEAALTDAQIKVTFSHALLLAEPLKAGDITTAKRLMSTIIASPAFVGAAIHEGGRSLASVGETVEAGDAKRLHAEPIMYSDEQGIYEIGRLVTLTSDAPINQAVWQHFERHLITMGILVLSLGCAVMIAHHYTIGKPLSTIMRVIDTAREGSQPARILWRSPDEIGRLAEAFDNYVQSDWSYKRDLVATNTLLEDRVALRTRELSEALENANRAREEVAQIALEDSLTKLLNRRAFVDHLVERLAKSRRKDDVLAMMLIDLDRFKNVNDSLGHSTGDDLLRATADRLRLVIGDKGMAARLGGDEFAISLYKISTIDDVAKTAQQIITELNQPLTIDGKVIYPGASMGIACHPNDGDNHEALMANADIALYRAKHEGRGRFCFFDADMRASVNRADHIAAALQDALEKKELVVAYQPKVDLSSGRLIGLEALLRWQHETLGQVPPDELLSIAEDRGMILSIGRAVADHVTNDLAEWLGAGLDPGTIAINIHPVELRRRSHMTDLLSQIENCGLTLDRFILEVTENCVIGRGNEEALAILCELDQQGLALSLDDFGTGYASLTHLRELPLNEIKIDKSFTVDMIHDPRAAAIVSATLDLADDLQIQVVAEGIETEEQVDCLRTMGSLVGQGYYFGRPMSASKIRSWLEEGPAFVTVEHQSMPTLR